MADDRVRVYARRGPRYAPFCAFRSHEPEFDFLKSLEVEEKVSQLQFCGGRGDRCGGRALRVLRGAAARSAREDRSLGCARV